MDYLIDKSDSSVVEMFSGGATKIQLPGMIGKDAIHVGGAPPKRPMDLGDYLLIKATEVDEPIDTATQKRGPTTTIVNVPAQTVIVTRTTVAKNATDLLNDVYAARQSSVADGGYGTYNEQFEILGEQGIGAYQQHVAAVKTRHPKP